MPIESGLNEEVKIIGLFRVEMAPNKIEEEMKMEPPKEQEAKRSERRRSAIKRTKRRREKERERLFSTAEGVRVIIITSKIYMESILHNSDSPPMERCSHFHVLAQGGVPPRRWHV